MDQVIILSPYTMIALHLRDSTPYLIAASQAAGFGNWRPSADHPFCILASRACEGAYY